MKQRRIQGLESALLATAVAFVTAAAAGAVNVSVNLDDVKAEVPRTLYGTGMEDVNHEIYGGLDAQRLYDESFEEELPPQVIPHSPRGSGNKTCGRQWTDVSTDGGILMRDSSVAHWGKASQLLMPAAGTAGVANRGLNGWGGEGVREPRRGEGGGAAHDLRHGHGGREP